MFNRVCLTVVVLAAVGVAAAAPRARGSSSDVMVIRTPDEGLQPQAAVDRAGIVHVVYFKGPAAQGDLFYARLNSATGRFSGAVRVNTNAGSAIATGTVRGAHLALGRNGRVHVAWMGSSVATHRATGGATPMLYARMNDAGTAFEQERNLLQFATGLDGGGSLAADAAGRVYVAWHAGGPSSQGEGDRRVWVSRSEDDGRTFAREVSASPPEQGACGCCGMRAAVDDSGTLFMLFRSASAMVNRDTYLLTSHDHAASFRADKLHGWNVGACQMSTYALAATRERTFAAWETAGQVHWLSVDAPSDRRNGIVTPGGSSGGRKHPAIAATDQGEVLLVWTEGTGWNKGGRLAWQRFDAAGRPVGARGDAPGVAPWSLGAAAALPDGRFAIVY
jgi:hypothetical protein